MKRIIIDLSTLYDERARIDRIEEYVFRALEQAGEGNEVVLTGRAPVWLYLVIAHELHGKAAILKYYSPVAGEITIFNHNPY